MTYFVAEVEGDAPGDMSEEEIRDRLNEDLPDWVDCWVTRYDR